MQERLAKVELIARRDVATQCTCEAEELVSLRERYARLKASSDDEIRRLNAEYTTLDKQFAQVKKSEAFLLQKVQGYKKMDQQAE